MSCCVYSCGPADELLFPSYLDVEYCAGSLDFTGKCSAAKVAAPCKTTCLASACTAAEPIFCGASCSSTAEPSFCKASCYTLTSGAEAQEPNLNQPAWQARPENAKKRWADMLSDSEDERIEAPRAISRGASEDEQNASATSSTECFIEPTCNEQAENVDLRPRAIARISREQRVDHVSRIRDEFCSLDFDQAEAQEQMALTLRMQALLKSLAAEDVYWTENGNKRRESRYSLLGLHAGHIDTLAGLTKVAEGLCDARRFRAAYTEMCKARACLNSTGADLSGRALVVEVGQSAEKSDLEGESKRQVASLDSRRSRRKRPGKSNGDVASSGPEIHVLEVPKTAEPDGSSRWPVPSQGQSGTDATAASRRSSLRGKGVGSRYATESHQRWTGQKLQCQFVIGIEEDNKFHVVQRLLGSHGKNVKYIAQQTGAKLRLRGHGSKFLEGPEQQESSDPLMLCVSAPNTTAYEAAKYLTRNVIEEVYAQHRSFCLRFGLDTSNVQIQLHEGPRDGAR